MTDARDVPRQQYLSPDVVLIEMAEAGSRRAISLTGVQVLVLSVIAGGLITVGALLSTLIATGTDHEGVQRPWRASASPSASSSSC